MTFMSKNSMLYQEQQIRSEMESWIVFMVEQTNMTLDDIREKFDEEYPQCLDFFEEVITDLVYN